MSIQNRNKLNYLLANWRHNALTTSKALVNKGYSRQLIKKYADHGWLQRAADGVYARPGATLHWAAGVYALQKELSLPVHIGGLSALTLHGLAHNVILDLESAPFYLFNTSNTKKSLPQWFKNLFPQYVYAQYHINYTAPSLELKSIEGTEVYISSPEQAALELLALVPHAFSYEQAAHLIENLQLLRPAILQTLLEKCSSIKIKRLFLYFAEKNQLPCFAQLNCKKIDLGSGKRVIGSGGEYIAKYQLSVPLIATEDESGVGHV